MLTVGDAGSLRTPCGPLVWDEAGSPEAVLAVMPADGDAHAGKRFSIGY